MLNTQDDFEKDAGSLSKYSAFIVFLVSINSLICNATQFIPINVHKSS